MRGSARQGKVGEDRAQQNQSKGHIVVEAYLDLKRRSTRRKRGGKLQEAHQYTKRIEGSHVGDHTWILTWID